MKKILIFLMLCVLVLTFSTTTRTQATEDITIRTYVGLKSDLDMLLGAEDGTYEGYEVKSSAKKVASVKKGTVNAKKAGTTVLTLSKGKNTEKITLKVVKPWIKVHMLDVAQGDSFLIQTVNSNILIDTGEYKEYPNLKKQLEHFGAEQLDALIVTHFDTDHFGSAQSVLRDYLKDDGVFIHPLRSDSNNVYTNLQKYLLKNPVREHVLSAYDVGTVISDLGMDGMEFMLLSADAGDDINDSSLVFRLIFFGSSWLFTGDASAPVLNSIMAKYPEQIKIDVFKVAHHGSGYSNPLLFINKSSPQIALISVGKDNAYGHPDTTILSRLDKYSGSIYRTDLDGTVTVKWKNNKYTVKKESLITRISPVKKKSGEGDDDSERIISPVQVNTEGLIIGNRKSHAYHLPTCRTLPAEQNRVYFESITDAQEAGYHACGNCHPKE